MEFVGVQTQICKHFVQFLNEMSTVRSHKLLLWVPQIDFVGSTNVICRTICVRQGNDLQV